MTLEEAIKPFIERHIYYNPGNLNNCKIEVRSVVDDHYIVFRRWSIKLDQWFYKMEHISYFELLAKEGYLINK